MSSMIAMIAVVATLVTNPAPISVSTESAISPVSMPASVNMVVTPAFFSPKAMHQLIGAAPR